MSAATVKVTNAIPYPMEPPNEKAITKMAVRSSRETVIEFGRFTGVSVSDPDRGGKLGARGLRITGFHLPSVPAAEAIHMNSDGEIEGLF